MKRIRKIISWIINHTLGHLVTYPIIGVIFLFFTEIATQLNFIEEPAIINYFKLHPARAFITLLIFGFIVIVFIRGYHFLKTAFRNREILLTVGVSGFWSHSNNDQKQANWDYCQKRISSDGARQLRILGATGWETFGKKEAPLHDLVDKFTGEIKILLLKPGSDAVSARALSIGVNPDDYNKEINDTIYFCKQLKARGKPITVKVYDQSPIWKTIFTENYMWLQCYKQNEHVDDTPVYMLFANKNNTSLYYPLLNVFLKKWNYDKNQTVVEPGSN